MHRFECGCPQCVSVYRNVPPSKWNESVPGDRQSCKLAACFCGGLVSWQKEDTHSEFLRWVLADTFNFAAEEREWKLSQEAGAVASAAVGIECATMSKVA